MDDRLERAREYIAKGDDYYLKAGREMAALIDDGWTVSAIAREVDRGRNWVRDVVAAARECGPDHNLKVDWHRGTHGTAAEIEEGARRLLSDDEKRQRVIDELPTEQVEALARSATDTAVERSRAARAEHQTEPTAGELSGGETFDPSEYWADTLVIRVNRNARELTSLIKRAGGLLFGSMSPSEAHDYLSEAERLIAEARAAAQEQERDRQEVQP